jgi:hypothetical protein
MAVTVAASLEVGGAVTLAAQGPVQARATVAQAAVKPSAKAVKARAADEARAARIKTREKADNAAWAAFVAARREPKSVLKGITLTSSVKNTTRFMAERYLDRFEELNKADKNAYRTDADTSTLIGDIMLIRLEQRAELRAVLTRAQRVQFDSNVATLVALRAGDSR